MVPQTKVKTNPPIIESKPQNPYIVWIDPPAAERENTLHRPCPSPERNVAISSGRRERSVAEFTGRDTRVRIRLIYASRNRFGTNSCVTPRSVPRYKPPLAVDPWIWQVHFTTARQHSHSTDYITTEEQPDSVTFNDSRRICTWTLRMERKSKYETTDISPPKLVHIPEYVDRDEGMNINVTRDNICRK